MLPPLIRALASGTASAETQNGEAVYCSLVTREQGRIDWNKSAGEIDAHVRAYTPWPLSFTSLNGRLLYILEGKPLQGVPSGDKPPGTVAGIDRAGGILIQTGDGIYAVSHLQWQAKKALDWRSFLNGARDFPGSILQ
jgi:methionyl-tRNA formyltransferase